MTNASARLAAAPITWGVCELPDWGRVPPFEVVLDEMASAAFAGTELGSPGFLPDDPAALRRALAQRRLQLVGAFCPLPLHAPARHAEGLSAALDLARFLAEAGCETLVAAEAGDDRRRAVAGRVGPADGVPPDLWPRMGAALAELAERARPLGVQVVFHPHAGTYVETESELDALLAATPEVVGLCLDTGHIAYGGGDPVAVARRHIGRIRHVHVKDVDGPTLRRVRQRGVAYSQAVGEGVFAPLGQGTIDFPALVGLLRDAGYAGWWVLEQDVRLGDPWPDQDPATNARQSARYLRTLLEAGA